MIKSITILNEEVLPEEAIKSTASLAGKDEIVCTLSDFKEIFTLTDDKLKSLIRKGAKHVAWYVTNNQHTGE